MRRLFALGLAAAVAAGAASTSAAPRPISLAALTMADASHGYAIAGPYGRYRLLRTGDGGSRWSDITPAGVRPSAPPALLGRATLFVPAQVRAHVFEVLRSDDGGGTWTPSRPFRAANGLGIETPVAVDPTHLYVAIGEGAAAGSEGEALYASADGGRTWGFVSGTTVARAAPGTLPFGCDKNGFGFATPTVGWASGNCAGGSAFLYRTSDGGRTWRHVRLPGLPDCECDVSPPRFFAPRRGALTVFGWTENARSRPLGRVYWTSDGGAHWHPTSARWGRATQAVSVSATGAAWVVTAAPGRIRGPFKRLFVTSGAGRAWRRVTLPFDGANDRLVAVSARVAFAYSTAPGRSSILRTLDGGRTWQRVATALAQ